MDIEPLQSTPVRRSAAEWVKDHTNLVPISTIPPPREIPHHLRRAPDHPPRSSADGTLVADTLLPSQGGPSPNVLESFVLFIIYDLDPPRCSVRGDGYRASVP